MKTKKGINDSSLSSKKYEDGKYYLTNVNYWSNLTAILPLCPKTGKVLEIPLLYGQNWQSRFGQ